MAIGQWLVQPPHQSSQRTKTQMKMDKRWVLFFPSVCDKVAIDGALLGKLDHLKAQKTQYYNNNNIIIKAENNKSSMLLLFDNRQKIKSSIIFFSYPCDVSRGIHTHLSLTLSQVECLRNNFCR